MGKLICRCGRCPPEDFHKCLQCSVVTADCEWLPGGACPECGLAGQARGGIVFMCPECNVYSQVEKWVTVDFHDDGYESYACPSCKAEIHETNLRRRCEGSK